MTSVTHEPLFVVQATTGPAELGHFVDCSQQIRYFLASNRADELKSPYCWINGKVGKVRIVAAELSNYYEPASRRGIHKKEMAYNFEGKIMAKKATKKTPNKDLIRHILEDQADMFVEHLGHSKKRAARLDHNVAELLRRLGETPDEGERFWVC